MKYYDKHSLESKGFIWLTLPHHSAPSKDFWKELKTGRYLEADAETIEGFCLLA